MSPHADLSAPFRVLVVEDDEATFLLLEWELRAAGHRAELTCVTSAAEMNVALDGGAFDVVISDWSVPGFGAAAAAQLLHSRTPHVPFIVLSGAIDDTLERAARELGALACVSKGETTRLLTVLASVWQKS